jgi:hypothetical protein
MRLRMMDLRRTASKVVTVTMLFTLACESSPAAPLRAPTPGTPATFDVSGEHEQTCV